MSTRNSTRYTRQFVLMLAIEQYFFVMACHRLLDASYKRMAEGKRGEAA